MSKIMKSILINAEAREARDVENAALIEGAFEPWQ